MSELEKKVVIDRKEINLIRTVELLKLEKEYYKNLVILKQTEQAVLTLKDKIKEFHSKIEQEYPGHSLDYQYKLVKRKKGE